jgi:hypothetical protein
VGQMLVTADELMAGAAAVFDIEVPVQLLSPRHERLPSEEVVGARRVRLRPLTVKDIQLIARAARDDEVLTSTLMVQQAVVEPPLKADQVAELPSGVVRFLVERINEVSGLTSSEDELREITDSPIVQAFFALAREFNWTPQQVRELTVGQLLGYLEMLNQARRPGASG